MTLRGDIQELFRNDANTSVYVDAMDYIDNARDSDDECLLENYREGFIDIGTDNPEILEILVENITKLQLLLRLSGVSIG